MSNKEMAKRLREASSYVDPWTVIEEIADELDPPRPAPGTVVWWRFQATESWEIGKVHRRGSQVPGIYNLCGYFISLCDVEYELARVLTQDEVALPLGVAMAIAGEESQYNQKLYTAFAVEARATLAREIVMASAEDDE